jgi:hypothetical protein
MENADVRQSKAKRLYKGTDVRIELCVLGSSL